MGKNKLVYWGAGNIGKLCLKLHPDVRPEFFIDSNWEAGECEGISVKKPEEVQCWDEIFVVITTTDAAFSSIAQMLNRRNLIQNQNYVGYQAFFETGEETIDESISFFQGYIENNENHKKAILIFATIFASRLNSLVSFFHSYGLKRMPQKCVLFSDASIIDKEYASKVIGYPAFKVPKLCTWSGSANGTINLDESKLSHISLLSENEKNWIYELEERKVCEDKQLSYKVTSEIYWYYKNLFSIFQPLKIIIMDGWKRQSYILAELAKKNHIPYVFMEYGWIPGTLQFDGGGISGQSEYAVDPGKILNLEVKNREKVREVRKYIIANKMDTVKFRNNSEDEINLQRVDKRKKTVFFVGMGDYSMGINPQSDYWKQYVSSIFSSTKDAVLYVAEICKKNDWNFVFKPHPNPANQDELDEESLNSNIIQVKYTEIDRLIQLADAVVSIASAVDYKVLIYGKPLVQLGHTTLYKKGCSYEVDSKDLTEDQIKSALEKGMTKEQNENFELHMGRLLENYLWDDLSDRELRYGLSLDTDFFDI
ncbi:MAG: hypothetical protein NC341_04090 [Blautia sp.]|nr:hypothetical protein [Blautia sp.]MCM1200778.1 hypothetical protein [Bacteroides fragilis]